MTLLVDSMFDVMICLKPTFPFLDVIHAIICLCVFVCCTAQIAGCDVFASTNIEPGQFICQYYGQLISKEEGDKRERAIPSCFRYFFQYQSKSYWYVSSDFCQNVCDSLFACVTILQQTYNMFYSVTKWASCLHSQLLFLLRFL